MTPTRRDFAALTLGLPLAARLVAPGRARAAALAADPLVIATGGAAGDSLPAWTAAAYELAIRDGADVLAAAVVPTRDGLLAVRPDGELSATTDVAGRADFAARKKTVTLDGGARTGWFAEDFTLAELKTLVCGPPGTRRRPGQGGILSFEELIAIARAGSVRTARVIGVHATMVRPAYYAAQDLAIEPRLADTIRTAGYNSAAAAIYVASDSSDALRTIGDLTRARRVLRLSATAEAAGPLTQQALAPQALRAASTVAWGIAPDIGLVLDLAQPRTLPPTTLAAEAHAAGLAVQAWATDLAGAQSPPLRPSDLRRLAGALFAAGCEAVAAETAGPAARARADLQGADRG